MNRDFTCGWVTRNQGLISKLCELWSETQLPVFSEDEWDTKEGTGKSMKNALYEQQHGKRHLSGLSDEKIKPIALAIVELH